MLDVRRAGARRARRELVLFPELTLCGYPPEDLLLHRGLRAPRRGGVRRRCSADVRGIASSSAIPSTTATTIYNSAALLRDGRVLANYRKQALPNYARVRREALLPAGRRRDAWSSSAGAALGLMICEDIWVPAPVARRGRGRRRAACS